MAHYECGHTTRGKRGADMTRCPACRAAAQKPAPQAETPPDTTQAPAADNATSGQADGQEGGAA